MKNLRLTEKVDLSVYYDADTARYEPRFFEKLGLTRERFIAHYADCPSLGFEADGRPIGGIIFDRDRDRTIHLAVLPEYHGRWAFLWKTAQQWLFALEDPVYVKIERFNEKCIRFADRSRWERVAEDESFVTYKGTARKTVGARTASLGCEAEAMHA